MLDIPEWFIGGPWDMKTMKEVLPEDGPGGWSRYAPKHVDGGQYHRRQFYIGTRIFTVWCWADDLYLTDNLVVDRIMDWLLTPYQVPS